MELALVKLLFYGFIGAIGALVIYITALALFLNNKLERIRKKELISGLVLSDLRRIQQEFSEELDGELLILKAIRWLEMGLNAEQAIKKVRIDLAAVMLVAAQMDNY